MFTNALAGAIDAAHPKQFDYLSRQLWQAHAAGHIPDQEAQALAERLHRRRAVALGAPAGFAGPPRGYFIQRSAEQRSPDRAASIAAGHIPDQNVFWSE
jgi:hypothetical protein